MGTSVLSVAAVALGGALIGALARPRKWQAMWGLVGFAVVFLGIGFGTAAWFGYTEAQVHSALLLSAAAPDPEQIIVLFYVAYAALFGSCVLAMRIARAKRQEVHEP
jgi:hypothetical protein